MVSKYKNITLDIREGIATLMFNRPDQLNAMNRKMMDEIIIGIEEVNDNNDVLVGLIRGAGRAFMAGADIKEYANQSLEEFMDFQRKGIQLYESIEKAKKPWIAAVNGFALGGGLEIALACDLIVASHTAKMGLPEVFLGLVPGGGGTQRLVQKVGINRAKEMLFTGGQYTAATLCDWGIVNEVYPEDKFDEEVIQFAQKLARRPRKAIEALKGLARLSLSPIPLEQKINEEGEVVTSLFYTEEAQRAIKDFIQKT